MTSPVNLRFMAFAPVLALGLFAASCTAILGIDKDYREGSGGAGGSGSAQGGATTNNSVGGGSTSSSANVSSATTSSSGAGGAAAVWHSWDVTTSGVPPALSVLDTNGQNRASIFPYQSTSLVDLGVNIPLTYFNSGTHPAGFTRVSNYWTPKQGDLYPYVGKSTVARGGDNNEGNAPLP